MAKQTGEAPKDQTPQGGQSNGGKPNRDEHRTDYVRRLEERERFYRNAYYRKQYYARRNWNRPYWNRWPYYRSNWWSWRRYDGHQQPPKPEPQRVSDNRQRQDGPRYRWFQPRPIWERERLAFNLLVRLIVVVAIVRFLLAHFTW